MKKKNIHFDKIASSYDEQFPRHIREYLLRKKTRLTVKTLKKYGISQGSGIDLGCGTGWYLKIISEYGYRMIGIDNSASLVEIAKKNNEGLNSLIENGDILALRFNSESFDFAYCINSLHHLRNDDELSTALREIRRILKKGGMLIIHELNTFFLFRLYMNYVFPLTNAIDNFGGENWIGLKKLSKQHLFQIAEVYYYTFLPHIIPKFLFKFFCKINNYLERVSLRKFGVHYMAVLIK